MGLVAAVGTAVTAVAASVGVAVAATALTVGFTTIAAVGAVVGVVGAVTHNKTLSMVGLGLGAVGGIGALAAGAGLLGSGAGLLGEAPTTAAAADAAAAGSIDSVAGASGLGNAAAAEEMLGLPAAGSAGGMGMGDITSAIGAGKSGMGFIEAASSEAPPDIGHAVGGAGGGGGGGGSDTSADALNAAQLTKIQGGFLNTASPVADVTSATTGAPLVPPPTAPGTSAADAGRFGDPNTNQDFLTGEGAGSNAASNFNGGSSAFKGILDFANRNPVVALGALQAGGSLLSGLTNTVTPAQVGALNSQAAANDAATALVKQQTANLNMPKAVASSVPVTGQAQLVPTPLRPLSLPQSSPAGFINQNPVPGPSITGVAA